MSNNLLQKELVTVRLGRTTKNPRVIQQQEGEGGGGESCKTNPVREGMVQIYPLEGVKRCPPHPCRENVV